METINDKRENIPLTPSQEVEKRLLRRADHLANFGTLTSLLASGAYFMEQTILKGKLSANVAKVTLGAIFVGVVSSVASYYYRYKAGRVALENQAACLQEYAAETAKADSVQQTSSQHSWVDKSHHAVEASHTLR